MHNCLVNEHTHTRSRKPSNTHIGAVFLIIAAFVSIFLASSGYVSADTGATVQTTGATVADLIDPTAPIDSPSNPSDTSTDGSLNKSYTRFEVNQEAKLDLTGTLAIEGDGFNKTVPYSVSAGDRLSAYVIFPERTGHYQLWLRADGQEVPLVWVEGYLERIREGEYLHQFIGGRANPDAFTLSQDEPGMMIAIGSVKAMLNSCVQFFAPTDAVFNLGVDVDGDGEISDAESVNQEINSQQSACVSTPESKIPLTSRYMAQVRTPEGGLLALNSGLYDFLNKSSVNSEKEAVPTTVNLFKVAWIRTPVATSIEVMNSSLRADAVYVTVVPEVEEVTADFIQNGQDGDTTPYSAIEDSSSSGGNGDADSHTTSSSGADSRTAPDIAHTEETQINQLFQTLVDNWMLLVITAAAVFMSVLFVRGITSVGSLSYQKN